MIILQKNAFGHFIHGFKSAILVIFVIFQKSADWLDWPCPVSAALKNGLLIFYTLIFVIFLIMKPLSEVAPRLLVIQIQIQAV